MNNQKGFGLIELIVAMFILGMGLTCAVQLHYSTARNNRNGNVLSMMHMAAKTEFETLRGKSISDLEEGVFTKQVGVVSLETTITKDPNRTSYGQATIIAKVRNKTVRYETKLNNLTGRVGG
jgi:prepilin-type N-terminal cleavage/methylation domain-containing protein